MLVEGTAECVLNSLAVDKLRIRGITEGVPEVYILLMKIIISNIVANGLVKTKLRICCYCYVVFFLSISSTHFQDLLRVLFSIVVSDATAVALYKIK